MDLCDAATREAKIINKSTLFLKLWNLHFQLFWLREAAAQTLSTCSQKNILSSRVMTEKFVCDVFLFVLRLVILLVSDAVDSFFVTKKNLLSHSHYQIYSWQLYIVDVFIQLLQSYCFWHGQKLRQGEKTPN